MHHLGFGFHYGADPSYYQRPPVRHLLAFSPSLEPLLDQRGLVLEHRVRQRLLTRYLVEAGHRVIATDASPAMLDLTRRNVPDAEDIRQLVLPDDPVPSADAVVSIGHVLSYLDDEAAVDRGLVAAARALNPDGVLAVDLCDLGWGASRRDDNAVSWIADDWVLVMRTSLPTQNGYVREMTTFVRNDDGSWRRDDERHDNVLIDTSRVSPLLAEQGVEADVRRSFGDEQLPGRPGRHRRLA